MLSVGYRFSNRKLKMLQSACKLFRLYFLYAKQSLFCVQPFLMELFAHVHAVVCCTVCRLPCWWLRAPGSISWNFWSETKYCRITWRFTRRYVIMPPWMRPTRITTQTTASAPDLCGRKPTSSGLSKRHYLSSYLIVYLFYLFSSYLLLIPSASHPIYFSSHLLYLIFISTLYLLLFC